MKDIRALQRGLEVLRLLNTHNGSTLSDIVRLTKLPKSTTYRILYNLCTAGYVTRDSHDNRYRLTPLVKRLSCGYDDDPWITEVAQPLIHELGRKVVYPVALSTIYGTHMIVRDTTSSESAMSLDYYGTGTLLPLFNSAAGKVYLAFCSEANRQTILAACEKQGETDSALARDRDLLHRMLAKIRQDGYAFDFRAKRPRAAGKMSTISVPVMANGTIAASLTMRYIDSAMTGNDVVRDYLPTLKAYAAKIGEGIEAHQRALAPDQGAA